MAAVPPLVITDEERAELHRRVRAPTTPNARPSELGWCCWPPRRAHRQIAPVVGMNQHTVAHWRRRFAAGCLAGLEDRQRPGRPPV
jgi:transposase